MILLALIFLIFPPARAQMIAAPFWQARQTLNFTTTSQTIFNLNCSGITTIQNRRSNVAVNVSSNVVIDLAATDTTFYSDADCANPITSITMASGTSSVSFYFISATTGAKTVSATAPRYIPATQSQTVNTNGFIWIGGAGCDGNWATGACWSGGVAPSAASQIVIDGSCTLNCSPTISANISIAKVRLTNSCSSTITQANGVSITVTGWYQDCGTFVGGNAASPVTINGNYSLVGGNYTATAGTWTVTEDFVVQNTPVFSANAGLLTFNNGTGTSTLTPGTVTYNNVSFNSSYGDYTISGTMTVAGTLTLAATSTAGGGGTLTGGTIVAQGNVTITNYGYNGSTLIQVTGNSTIDGSAATTAWMPALEIVAGVNTVNLVGTLRLSQAYTYTSGTVAAGTSTLVFNSGASNYTLTPGSVTYNNISFNSSYGDYTISGTMTVAGVLTLAATSTSGGGGTLTGGTIVAQGNVTITNYGYNGSTLIQVTGNSTIDGSAATTAWMPALEIVAGVNTVNLVGTLRLSQAYTYTSGTVAAGTSTLIFGNGNTGYTLTPGTVTYNNITFSSGNGGVYTISGTMTVAGTLSLASNQMSLNGGTIVAQGNVTITNYGYVGSTLIQVTGATTGTSIIDGSAATTAWMPALEIVAGVNTVNLVGTLRLSQAYTYTSGTVAAGTSTLIFGNGNTGYTLTPGTVTYNNITFSSGNGGVYTISGTMTVAGTLSLASNQMSLNGGTIVAQGNVTITNYGYVGSTLIQVTGATTGTSTIDGSAATNANLPVLEIAAGANTVNLVGTIRVSNNYTYTSGTVNVGTSTLVLQAATGTITPGTVAYNNVTFSGASGTVTVVGTMTVGGNLTLSRSAGTRAIDGGTLDVLGNVIATTPSTGTTNIKMSGGTAATITGGNFTICGTSFEVDKAGSSVSLLTSALNYDSVGQTFTLTAGSMDMAGLAMTVKALSLNGTTLTKSAGVLTVNSIAQGTGALFGGIVNP